MTQYKQFHKLLNDDATFAWLCQQGKTTDEAGHIVLAWRVLANKLGVPFNINLHVALSGVGFKTTLPESGPTWNNFSYLQGWDFVDQPTRHELVSMVPAVLPESICTNYREQKSALEVLKVDIGLPSDYSLSLGSAVHIGFSAVEHNRVDGSNPFGKMRVRTETMLKDSSRLELEWRPVGGLYCTKLSHADHYKTSELGAFAVGVVQALDL